uniref:Saposin B-type domain-containing protein n=1 Tax=Angiostrongylus cantonensis TaxID=6313 RepID=A0A0K0DLG2_ANGCA
MTCSYGERERIDNCEIHYTNNERDSYELMFNAPVVVFMLYIQITEQCMREESRSNDSLCDSCEHFLLALKLEVPRKLDSVVEKTREAAREYIPYYNSVDGYICEFFGRTLRRLSTTLLGVLYPRQACAMIMMC